MKLIVGLGNPGKNYENTRHNCGFKAIDFYTAKNNLKSKKKFEGEYFEHKVKNEKYILLKPLTYMNLSGISVRKFVDYFNIDIKDIIVIYDDKDFDIGTYKIKRNGSSAGHNGIKNIMEQLGTQDVYRIRIGISKNDIKMENYVLSKFTKEEEEKLNNVVSEVSNIIDDFSSMTIDKLMEKYNRN